MSTQHIFTPHRSWYGHRRLQKESHRATGQPEVLARSMRVQSRKESRALWVCSSRSRNRRTFVSVQCKGSFVNCQQGDAMDVGDWEARPHLPLHELVRGLTDSRINRRKRGIRLLRV